LPAEERDQDVTELAAEKDEVVATLIGEKVELSFYVVPDVSVVV
jgi:hypothetical protein